MPTSDKDKKPKFPVDSVWPFSQLNHGDGEDGIPNGVRDVAVLVPLGYPDQYLAAKKEKALYVVEVEGLDGSYVLSSNGATRPYGAGH